MFIIDFDDTLFNTCAFKQARCQALKAIGVSEELFFETYQKAHDDMGRWTYSDERHADILDKQGFSRHEVYAALAEVSASMIRFIFSDTISFLESIRDFDSPCILLSLGDPDFQRRKVAGAGIQGYFTEEFLVNEKKADVVQSIQVKYTPKILWLINDKIDESQTLCTQFPHLKAVLKMPMGANEEVYRASNFPFFSTLTDIANYLKKHYE